MVLDWSRWAVEVHRRPHQLVGNTVSGSLVTSGPRPREGDKCYTTGMRSCLKRWCATFERSLSLSRTALPK